ncbi:MAG: ribonuclease III [Pseudomonadota bacterium]
MSLSREEKQHLKMFEAKLGYKFKKRTHLKRALTHKSYTNELGLSADDHNERYEYLGDAVLELSISHLLMEHFPNHPEGELSKLRAAIVNESELANMARMIQLGDFMYVGKGEDRTGGRDKPSLLSDAYEAVLGAIYLDRGYDKAYNFVQKHFKEVIKSTEGKGFKKDYKTRLQEVAQSKFRAVPRYKLVDQKGPDHQKTFVISLYIKDDLFGTGQGLSKKAAEQDAAKQALERLSCNNP